jgi:C4-dicarboxylate-specific signal transduction histidine kinase
MDPLTPAEQIRRLQRSMNDLVSLMALPAMWTGGDPSHIADTLLDVLLSMLHLDFAYMLLNDSDSGRTELVRLARALETTLRPGEIGNALSHAVSQWPRGGRLSMDAGDFFLATVPMGLQGEVGVVTAGSRRPDFAGEAERLLLSVAVNQAALALQHARLLQAQERTANDLDQRVAQRTAELARANDALHREMAERSQAEDALNELRTELAHVSRVSTLGAMTASIAHEINQPLAGIVTNASTSLRMLSADPPNVMGAQETARRTIRDAKRATDIIARLRTLFSKSETSLEPVDLNDASKEVAALSQRGLQESRATLQLELDDQIPSVRGDRIQLQQVILNLTLNAAEAMREVDDGSRQLIIRTSVAHPDGVLLTVQDSGPGIDPANLERIFDAFYTTKTGGLGMGLSICRKIIEAHGGKLWATAAVPRGAVFHVTLPFTPA